jgi:hypothetical protein
VTVASPEKMATKVFGIITRASVVGTLCTVMDMSHFSFFLWTTMPRGSTGAPTRALNGGSEHGVLFTDILRKHGGKTAEELKAEGK